MTDERRHELEKEIEAKSVRGVPARLIIDWLRFQGLRISEAKDFYADWLMTTIYEN